MKKVKPKTDKLCISQNSNLQPLTIFWQNLLQQLSINISWTNNSVIPSYLFPYVIRTWSMMVHLMPLTKFNGNSYLFGILKDCPCRLRMLFGKKFFELFLYKLICLSKRLYKNQIMGYSQTGRKKNTVSQGLKICPLTVYDLVLCPMLL